MHLTPRHIILCAAAIGACLAVAGCSSTSTLRADELQRGVQTIGSDAAEGRLVALGVAEERTKTTFTRVQAGDLAEDATHEAEKLHDAHAIGDVADIRSQAVTLAQDVASALGDLQVAPDDPDAARRTARRLDALSSRASRLAGEL